jgi:hypothetical protein
MYDLERLNGWISMASGAKDLVAPGDHRRIPACWTFLYGGLIPSVPLRSDGPLGGYLTYLNRNCGRPTVRAARRRCRRDGYNPEPDELRLLSREAAISQCPAPGKARLNQFTENTLNQGFRLLPRGHADDSGKHSPRLYPETDPSQCGEIHYSGAQGI